MPEAKRLGFRRPKSEAGASNTEKADSDEIKLPAEGRRLSNDDRHVSFSILEIHEFLVQIGDNPSCEGAPLCMSNECQNQRVINVNDWEATRNGRRRRKDLVLSATKRSRLLMNLGYSLEDIASAALETQKVRQEREESMGNKKWDGFNLVVELARRKLKKIVAKNKPQTEQSTLASRTA